MNLLCSAEKIPEIFFNSPALDELAEGDDVMSWSGDIVFENGGVETRQTIACTVAVRAGEVLFAALSAQ